VGAPDDTIPGVDIDLTNWQNFLQSPLGGAWERQEITILRNPNKILLDWHIHQINEGSNYTLFAFSGHGELVTSTDTHIHINDQQKMDATAFRSKAKKQTIILDCCRFPAERERFYEALAKNMSMEQHQDRQACRQLYDRHIETCDDGLVRLYSCSVNETAGDSEAFGGYYTNGLISSASATFRLQTIKQAHEAAKQKVARLRDDQHPVGEFPRSHNSFPFAVSTSLF